MDHRQCGIELSNNSNSYTLSNLRVFTESGFCEDPFPHMVDPDSVFIALFNKSTGTATGAVGVFTYDLSNPALNDNSHTMAVMFSVPYDRNLFNWFAVGIFTKGVNCDGSLFDTMYYRPQHNFVRARADGSSISYAGDHVKISATMSGANEAVLRVDISDSGN